MVWSFNDIPVMLIGDFNSVRGDMERENCRYPARDTRNFNSFIEHLGIEEIDTGWKIFTWFGHSGKNSKLDRSLINYRWIDTG